jgi:hypothetical protein
MLHMLHMLHTKIECRKLWSMDAGHGFEAITGSRRPVGGCGAGATHRRNALGDGGLHPPYGCGNRPWKRSSDGSPSERRRADQPLMLHMLHTKIERRKLWSMGAGVRFRAIRRRIVITGKT